MRQSEELPILDRQRPVPAKHCLGYSRRLGKTWRRLKQGALTTAECRCPAQGYCWGAYSPLTHLKPSMTEGTGRSHTNVVRRPSQSNCHGFHGFPCRQLRRRSGGVAVPFPLPCLRSIATSGNKVCFNRATTSERGHLRGWCERLGINFAYVWPCFICMLELRSPS